MKTLTLFRSLVGGALLVGAAFALCAATRADTAQQASFPEIFVVNTTFDASTGADDAFPGDGQCETVVGNGVCTLRAAIEETNAHAGGDGIFFSIPTTDPGYSNGRWTISLTKALPNISDGVNITGPGSDKLIVARSLSVGPFRIFNVTTTGTVNFSGLTLQYGFGINEGGGIQNASTGTVNVNKCTISNNGAINGGGVANATTGRIILSNCLIENNYSELSNGDSSGGGIYSWSGNVTMTNCTLSSNTASSGGTSGAGSGGGIYNRGGTVTMTNCTLSSNIVSSNSNSDIANCYGGGVYNAGTLLLSNSTIDHNGNTAADNHSLAEGGGIYNDGAMEVTNSTIDDNSGFQTGGIYNIGTAIITNSTIAYNAAYGSFEPHPGGIENDATQSHIQVKSCIIAGSDGSGDVSGAFTSGGFNFISRGDYSTGFTAATDQTGTFAAPLDPKLDGLKDNGGPTWTIALLPGSPAIDKGTSNGLTGALITDQRGVGYKRTVNKSVANATGGDGTDIGAFELGAQIKAVSRKTHGSVGTFGLNLPLYGARVGVECRTGGASGVHQVLLTFPNAVSVSDASVTPDPKAPGATGSVSSFSGSGSKAVTVNLTGVSNAQTILVNLLGVSDGTNTNDVSVAMGVLLGDTNNNRLVGSNDVTLAQSKVGQAITMSTFREDVTIDGAIDNTDVNLVQSKVGTKLP